MRATAKAERVVMWVPLATVKPLPPDWWKSSHPDGFDTNNPSHLEHLRAWGVVTVIRRSGRGKPKRIQESDHAEGNYNWTTMTDADKAACPKPVRVRSIGRGLGSKTGAGLMTGGSNKSPTVSGWVMSSGGKGVKRKSEKSSSESRKRKTSGATATHTQSCGRN